MPPKPSAPKRPAPKRPAPKPSTQKPAASGGGPRKPPAYHILAKPKNERGLLRVGALWENDFGGLNLTLEKPYGERPGVAKIVVHFDDGTEVDTDEYYLNCLPPFERT